MNHSAMVNLGYEVFEHSVKGVLIMFNKNYNNGPAAICYHGKKKSPTWYNSFKTEMDMFVKIDKTLKIQHDKLKAKELQKQKTKELAEELRSDVKVGDVFNTSWGWEQTNVEFYQIVGKPSKCRVEYREIGQALVDTGNMCGTVTPKVGDFISGVNVGSLNRAGGISKVGISGETARKTTPTQKHHKSWYA